VRVFSRGPEDPATRHFKKGKDKKHEKRCLSATQKWGKHRQKKEPEGDRLETVGKGIRSYGVQREKRAAGGESPAEERKTNKKSGLGGNLGREEGGNATGEWERKKI